MTAGQLEVLVCRIDVMHAQNGSGNVELITPDGVVSMIAGALSGQTPDNLGRTLIETFGMVPERLDAPEQIFASEPDQALAGIFWAGIMGGTA